MKEVLKARQAEMLKALITASVPLDLDFFKDKFEKQDRTIRYDLGELKEVCVRHKIEICYLTKQGYYIPAAQKTENDKQYIGNYTPKLIIGWSHTLTYKNFDLGINLRSWIDFDVYNTINMYYGIQGQGNLNVLKDAYGKFNHIKGEKQICDYFLEDGTFLKIDAITLGYTLPMKKYTNNLIDRIRIYGTVGNVCTITGYSGMNPEVDITGWDKGTEKFWSDFYPVVRTWTLGMQFNF